MSELIISKTEVLNERNNLIQVIPMISPTVADSHCTLTYLCIYSLWQKVTLLTAWEESYILLLTGCTG